MKITKNFKNGPNCLALTVDILVIDKTDSLIFIECRHVRFPNGGNL